MVSHELRTPLIAIKTGVKLIFDGMAGEVNVEQKELLNIVRTNVDRLDRLISNVLDLQRLKSGKIMLNLEENDINEVIKEIHSSMHLVIEGKGLQFHLNLSDGLPSLRFDKDAIAQVLVNLINNAFKFTDKGKIIVTTSKDNNFVCVAVKDSGVGIKKNELAKLFQPFGQLTHLKGKKREGSGLGLAICKEIIQLHGGKIWVESEPEKGSDFYFTLPC
jgi:signal transduction histidine kinase